MLRAWRSYIYMLIINPMLGAMYFSFLVMGFTGAISLSVVLIGLPLLVVMFSLTRRFANLDRVLAGWLLGVKSRPLPDDLKLYNKNPLKWIGAYLTSVGTWQRILALGLKLPFGMVSATLAAILTPFLLLETFVNMIGMNTGMQTGKILYPLAVVLSGLATQTIDEDDEAPGVKKSVTVPRSTAPRYNEHFDDPEPVHMAIPKRKNTLELPEDDASADDEYDYYIGDDGEIVAVRR